MTHGTVRSGVFWLVGAVLLAVLVGGNLLPLLDALLVGCVVALGFSVMLRSSRGTQAVMQVGVALLVVRFTWCTFVAGVRAGLPGDEGRGGSGLSAGVGVAWLILGPLVVAVLMLGVAKVRAMMQAPPKAPTPTFRARASVAEPTTLDEQPWSVRSSSQGHSGSDDDLGLFAEDDHGHA